MAQTVAVVSGTLSAAAAGTADFTSSGFGTPAAAIILCSNANTTSNPDTSGILSAGVWDGTNVRAAAFRSMDGSATSRAYRHSSDSEAVIIGNASSATSSDRWADYTISNITDGIRLTLDTDNTALSRHCVVILLAGVSAKVDDFQVNSSVDTAATSPSIGFAPTALVALSIGNGNAAPDADADHCIWSIGVAEKSADAQFATLFSSVNNVGTTVVSSYVASDRITGQLHNNSLSWAGEVTSWGADTFDITTRTGGGGADLVMFLALGGDASVQVGQLTTLTSTGNDAVSTSIAPDAVMIAATLADTLDNVESAANEGECVSIGAAEGTTEYAFSVVDGDNLGTTNNQSKYTAGNIIDVDYESSGFNDLIDASVDSMNASNFTLNYSAVAGSARYGWWMAFGNTGGSIIPQVMHHRKIMGVS